MSAYGTISLWTTKIALNQVVLECRVSSTKGIAVLSYVEPGMRLGIWSRVMVVQCFSNDEEGNVRRNVSGVSNSIRTGIFVLNDGLLANRSREHDRN